MLRTTSLLIFASLSSLASSVTAQHEDLTPVPLCRALESIEPGDEIQVVVSGIYAVDYFYDPEERYCRLDICPQTCVEFAPEVAVPEDLRHIHDDLESKGVLAEFRGILYGPPDVPIPPFLSSVSTAHRALARNSVRKLYCGNRYRTKLVVESILSFGPVPEETPWPEERERPEDEPIPVEMALPKYPPIARNIDYEGVALVAVTVVAGEVTDAQIQFGDAVLVTEVLANVQTWRFASNVSASFTVEYDFRLEKRTIGEGGNARLEMRLPHYVRVTGRSHDI
jgi:hypothetical protein